MAFEDFNDEQEEKYRQNERRGELILFPVRQKPARINRYQPKLAFLIIISLVVGSFFGAAAGPKILNLVYKEKPLRPLVPTPSKIINKKEDPGDELLVSTINNIKPSIVNIKTRSGFKHPGGLFIDNPEKIQGIGSGIIIRGDGYIITNQHVVEGAEDININFYDGSETTAKIAGQDSVNDIAVLKVNGKHRKLKAAPIGSSRNLKVGSTVLALGSPWELEHSVTAGIVSALKRKINVDSASGKKKFYPNLIQTDAAINPGNSGGALSDRYGNVIGINTLIYSQDGGYEGIGFAIPIESALDAAEQLISKGKVDHPYIGVIGRDLSGSKDQNADNGAVLVEVKPRSPASKAGLKTGDVVLSIDKETVKNIDDLIAIVRQKKVGSKIEMLFSRNSKTKNAKVTISRK